MYSFFWRISVLLVSIISLAGCSDQADKELLTEVERQCGFNFPASSNVMSRKLYRNPKEDSLIAVIQVPEKSVAKLSAAIHASAFYAEIQPALVVFTYRYKNKPVWTADNSGYLFIGHSCSAKFDTLTGIFNYKATSY